MEPVVILSLGHPTSADALSEIAANGLIAAAQADAAPAETIRIAGTPEAILAQLTKALSDFTGRAKTGDAGARAALEILSKGGVQRLEPLAHELAGKLTDRFADRPEDLSAGHRIDPVSAAPAGRSEISSTASPSSTAARAGAFAAESVPPVLSPPLAPFAYKHADTLVSEGRFREAAALLGAVAGVPNGTFDGLLGLAVCALQLKRPEVALALAHECLKLDPRHPRAHCLAAHCELKRGDRRAAQNHYALATRLARSRPEFREDLRAAQRALLLMHLA